MVGVTSVGWALNGLFPTAMAYYRQLVGVCVKILSTFDSSTTSVEDHLERFLESAESEVCTLFTSFL